MDLNNTKQCLANWIIEKVIQENSSCWKFVEFRLLDWNETYYINWLLYDLEEWDNMIRSYTLGSNWKKVTYSCENIDYQLKNLDLIQPWKQVYVIAEENTNKIVELSQDNIIQDLNLPKCFIHHYYNLNWQLYEKRWIDKCKITWKIQEIKKTLIDKNLCGFNLYIKVLDKNNNTYYIKWNEQTFLGELWSCIAPYTYPKYINWTKYFPQIWDEINVPINKDNYSILSTISESDINNLEFCQLTWNEQEFQNIKALNKEEIIAVINKLVRDNNEAYPNNKIYVKTYYNALYLEDSFTWTLVVESVNYEIWSTDIPKNDEISATFNGTQIQEIIQEQQEKLKIETNASSNYNIVNNTNIQAPAKTEKQEEEIVINSNSWTMISTWEDLGFSWSIKDEENQTLSWTSQVQKSETIIKDKNIYQINVILISIIIIILLIIFWKYVKNKID